MPHPLSPHPGDPRQDRAADGVPLSVGGAYLTRDLREAVIRLRNRRLGLPDHGFPFVHQPVAELDFYACCRRAHYDGGNIPGAQQDHG